MTVFSCTTRARLMVARSGWNLPQNTITISNVCDWLWNLKSRKFGPVNGFMLITINNVNICGSNGISWHGETGIPKLDSDRKLMMMMMMHQPLSTIKLIFFFLFLFHQIELVAMEAFIPLSLAASAMKSSGLCLHFLNRCKRWLISALD